VTKARAHWARCGGGGWENSVAGRELAAQTYVGRVLDQGELAMSSKDATETRALR